MSKGRPVHLPVPEEENRQGVTVRAYGMAPYYGEVASSYTRRLWNVLRLHVGFHRGYSLIDLSGPLMHKSNPHRDDLVSVGSDFKKVLAEHARR